MLNGHYISGYEIPKINEGMFGAPQKHNKNNYETFEFKAQMG
jgi:hypothetical protein